MQHLSDYGAEVAHAVNEQLACDILLVSLKLKGYPIGVHPYPLCNCPFKDLATSCLKLVPHLQYIRLSVM